MKRREERLATGIVATLGVVTLAALCALGFTLDWAVEREIWLCRASGYTALATLFGALCTSPTARLLEALGRRPATVRVRAVRRAFGMTSAFLATAHATLALSTYLSSALEAAVMRPYLRAGVLALAILLVLWLTSFPRVVRGMRLKLWKELHRLAYVAALLALQHLLLSPFAPRAWTLGLFGAVLAYGLLRFLPRRAPAVRDAGGAAHPTAPEVPPEVAVDVPLEVAPAIAPSPVPADETPVAG